MSNRSVVFTYYPNATSTEGTRIEAPWSKWCEEIIGPGHAVRGTAADTDNKKALDTAKDGPGIVLGDLPDGSPHQKKHIVAMHGIGIDIDSCTEDEAMEVLRRLDAFEYLIWTTHKHGSQVANGVPRLRIVLPLAEPIDKADYHALWLRLQAHIGGKNDEQTKDASRLNFLPSTFDPATSGCWSARHPGEWLAPDMLLTHAAKAEGAVVEDEKFYSPEEIAGYVTKIAGYFEGMKKDPQLREIGRRINRGEVFADSGGRHDIINEVTWEVARKFKGEIPVAAVAEWFAPSMGIMRQLDPSCPPLQDVINGYNGAKEKQKEFLAQKKQEAREAIVQMQTKGLGRYTPEELESIAAAQEIEVSQLDERWIIQHDVNFYFLAASGGYVGPFRFDARLAMTRILARAPVYMNEATATGIRRKTPSEVAEEAGSVAAKVVADCTRPHSFFNGKTATMHEAVCIPRDIKPAYNETIDTWLRLLAGDQYERLLDWLACAPKLDRLLCALYFGGKAGAGKNLFAQSLARLWTTGNACDIEQALATFNEDQARCPVVFADETVPKNWQGQSVTTKLRSMVSVHVRTLNRKFRTPVDMYGAIRLVLAANNADLLATRESMTAEDLEAIAERFLYIDVGNTERTAASDFLESLPHSVRNSWRVEDKFAQHVKFLEATREVKPAKRFWVQGDVSVMHRLLMTGNVWNSRVCEWLVRYLMNPVPFDSIRSGLVRRADGMLFVNTQALIDSWEIYIKETKIDPETANIGKALGALKCGRRQFRQGNRGPVWFHQIDVGHLFAWADQYHIGDRETMEQTLNTPQTDLTMGADLTVVK